MKEQLTNKKNDQKDLISSKLSHISEDQFSIFPENLNDDDIAVEQTVGLGFGADAASNTIACGFQYGLKKREKPLLKIEISCYYTIQPAIFKKLVNKGREIILPKSLAQHLAVITSGTARGILYSNTKNTAFVEYPMALINLTEIITKDITVTVK